MNLPICNASWPNAANRIALATLSLQNNLRKSQSRFECTPIRLMDQITSDGTFTPENWRDGAQPACLLRVDIPMLGNDTSIKAKEVRETLKDYFLMKVLCHCRGTHVWM